MLKEILNHDGIALVEKIFDQSMVEEWNKKLNPLFVEGKKQFRYNLDITRMFETGILTEFFNDNLRTAIKEVLPDAVLLSFESYEIAGKSTVSHINPDTDEGWHTDIAPLPGLKENETHYLCIFLYLTDVGNDSGGFEFRPSSPSIPLNQGDKTIYVAGPKGTTFFWNRSYFHRASPNKSEVRRRIIKVCLQHNYLQNNYIQEYANLIEKYPNDSYMRFILGEKFQSSHHGYRLPNIKESALLSSEMKGSKNIDLKRTSTFFRKIRKRLKKLFF